MQAAAHGHDGPPPPPGVEDFSPGAFLFDGTIFAIDRLIMVRLIVAAVLLLIFSVYTLRAKLVPGRSQSAVELLLEFVQKNISEEVLGKKEGRNFLPLLAILFVTIFFTNITGVIPILNISSNSLIGMPIVMAIFAYVGFIYAGVSRKGIRFFKDSVAPSGVPKVMLLLIAPIEFFSTFVIRPTTLALRLFVNMVAGHIILALTFWGTQVLFFYVSGPLKAAALVTFSASIAITFFEVFVAGLQAFIFTLLSAVYIKMSVDEH